MLLNTFLFISFFFFSPLPLCGFWEPQKEIVLCSDLCVCGLCVSFCCYWRKSMIFRLHRFFFYYYCFCFAKQNVWGVHFVNILFFRGRIRLWQGSSVYSYIYIFVFIQGNDLQKKNKTQKKGIPVSHPCWPPVGPQVAPHVAVLCRVLDSWGDTSSGKLRC